jgi:hypothetical protein
MTHDSGTPYNQVIDAGVHSAFPNVEKLALQPRFGFTWSPMGHTNTVLRGGIGIFSDLYQGVLMDEMIGNSPLTNGFTIAPAPNATICVPTPTQPCFTGGAPLAPGATGSVSQLGQNSNASFLSGFASGKTVAQIEAANAFFVPPNFTSIANQINNPKYLEWNFEIQQAIGSKTSLNIDYVGTHGYDGLIQNANLNACLAGFGQLPACAPAAGVTSNDQRFGSVRELYSGGVSNYAGLITTVTRKFSHGFQGSLNWTWAHALDDLTSTNPGTPFNLFDAQTYQSNPNCLRCQNYGNGDGDARHNLTANYVWELPFKTSSKGLNEVVSGWTVGGTFFAHTGLPWTPETFGPFSNGALTLGFLPELNLQPVAGVPDSCQSSGPGNVGNPTPCVNATTDFASTQTGWGGRRNQFRGLGYFDTDMNVNKSFAITERVKFELGGSFFNLLNHPNFGLPNPYGFEALGQMCSAGAALGCNALATQPATPYGSFQGAGVEGRLVQVHVKFSF